MSETNGHPNGAAANGRRSDDGKVRVAIVGVGNCANSFIQGVQYYKDADPAEHVPGLMHVDLGGYHVRDIEFVAAFDIDSEKVGKDLSEAIWSGQNDTIKFADVPELGVKVERGMTHDGLGKYLKQKITKAPGETADIVGILKETKADVLVCYLPVGSEQATKWYVEQALEAGVGFVNCLPVFIAREDYWDKRFREAGLPIIGDDIKSQVGATIVHRQLARLFHERGVAAGSAPRSSTSAATWTSSTCSSASASTRRRSRRPTPSPRHGPRAARATTSTSAPPTTCRG